MKDIIGHDVLFPRKSSNPETNGKLTKGVITGTVPNSTTENKFDYTVNFLYEGITKKYRLTNIIAYEDLIFITPEEDPEWFL